MRMALIELLLTFGLLLNCKFTFPSFTTKALVSTENCIVPDRLNYSKPVPCYCDAACSIYDDCCNRYDNITGLFSCMQLKKLQIPPVIGSNASKHSAFVFNRCPPGTNEQLRRLCEQPAEPSDGLDREVVVASNDSRLFRNAYCAQCHGVEFLDPKFLYSCKAQVPSSNGIITISPTTFQKYLKKSVCQLTIDLNSTNFRSCHYNIVTDCKEDFPGEHNATIKSMCRSAPNRIIQCKTRDIYRNHYCAACEFTDSSCIDGPLRDGIGLGGPVYKYSKILNFRKLVVTLTSQSEVKNQMSNIDSSSIESQNNSSFNENSSMSNSTQTASQAYDLVISYLTVTCCVLSTLSLVLLIVIYAAAPSLRNFGGLLTLSLASSLLVGLLCFLVGPPLQHVALACRVVGVVMYYAYLSSFAWMSLFALDVLKAFAMSAAASSAARGSSIAKRYARASVAGWGLPLVVTAAAVAMDALWPSSVVSARFGVGQCYFNSGYALLAWFYVPVAVSVIANVAMSVSVIVVVWRTTQQTKSARGGHGSNKQLIGMSLKVTTIFGATWVLGVTAALVDNKVFSDVSGLVNSLQGLFVMLSFVVSSRTIRAIKSRRSDISSSQKKKTISTELRSADNEEEH